MIAATVDERSVFLPDEAATLALGNRLAHVIEPGLYMALSGNLGTGKTTLTRGILRGLGYQGNVKSPTYTLVELYNLSKLHLYHFDLYRFNNPQEPIRHPESGGFTESRLKKFSWRFRVTCGRGPAR